MALKKQVLIRSMVGLLALSTMQTACSEDVEKPNIIIILADDLGYGDLGCYGGEQIKTPNCDRLAREGIRFTDMHSSSAVCTPSRYSLLTGSYNWRSWLKNWVIGSNMPLLIDTSSITIASMLKEEGYATGCVGKWHLGWGARLKPDWNTQVSPGPNEIGFDYFFGTPMGHDCSPQIQFYVENGRVAGLLPGEDITNKEVLGRLTRNLENTAIDLSKVAVDFIINNNPSKTGKPLFLYYPTTLVHFPITPHPRFKGMSNAGNYGDYVAEFDWVVGEILNSLDSLGLSKNTLVILTSDNGAYTSEQFTINGHKPNGHLRGSKCEIYEGGHRVPFIVRWPGFTIPGSTCDSTNCITDILATIAEITNYQLPDNTAEDSYSFYPYLKDNNNKRFEREFTIHHSISGMFAIRKGDWKLIEGIGNGFDPIDWPRTHQSAKGMPMIDCETGKIHDFKYYWPDWPIEDSITHAKGQLYNLKTDPAETINLWNDYPEIVNGFQRTLNECRNK